jgi:hypothetical protein
MLGIYRVAAQLVASRVVLSSTELVSYEICSLICTQNVVENESHGRLEYVYTALSFRTQSR